MVSSKPSINHLPAAVALCKERWEWIFILCYLSLGVHCLCLLVIFLCPVLRTSSLECAWCKRVMQHHQQAVEPHTHTRARTHTHTHTHAHGQWIVAPPLRDVFVGLRVGQESLRTSTDFLWESGNYFTHTHTHARGAQVWKVNVKNGGESGWRKGQILATNRCLQKIRWFIWGYEGAAQIMESEFNKCGFLAKVKYSPLLKIEMILESEKKVFLP